MYRILIVDNDMLSQEALEAMIAGYEQFEIVDKVTTGEKAVKVCRSCAVDLVFVEMQLPGISGAETGRLIRQFCPDTVIYGMTVCTSAGLIESIVPGTVKAMIEKPVMAKNLNTIFRNYKTEKEDTSNKQVEELVEILKERDFQMFYQRLPGIIDCIYENAGPEPDRLVKAFSYIGQQLTDTQNLYDEKNTIIELFPINKSLILEKKTSELWLFRVVDYLFQQSSMKRYPLLDNIFLYIDQHIKEEITLNKIIENCAVSQGYLSRIFRSQFHVSVTEYLHMKKMHLAKGYFYFTEYSIGEVAFRLGYSESSYFSRVFKKYENMTVKEYKNKIKK